MPYLSARKNVSFSNLYWQLTPSQPSAHWHEYPCTPWLRHTPLSPHGLDAHKSIPLEQVHISITKYNWKDKKIHALNGQEYGKTLNVFEISTVNCFLDRCYFRHRKTPGWCNLLRKLVNDINILNFIHIIKVKENMAYLRNVYTCILLDLKKHLPVWHISPENPGGHRHWDPPTRSRHVPPLMHGWMAHSFMSVNWYKNPFTT